MWQQPEYDTCADELLLAGQKAKPGLYRDLGTGRLVQLDQEDVLPASCDGRVACYIRLGSTWAQIIAQRRPERTMKESTGPNP